MPSVHALEEKLGMNMLVDEMVEMVEETEVGDGREIRMKAEG